MRIIHFRVFTTYDTGGLLPRVMFFTRVKYDSGDEIDILKWHLPRSFVLRKIAAPALK